MSSTWGRADQHTSHDSIESGAFCFACHPCSVESRHRPWRISSNIDSPPTIGGSRLLSKSGLQECVANFDALSSERSWRSRSERQRSRRIPSSATDECCFREFCRAVESAGGIPSRLRALQRVGILRLRGCFALDDRVEVASSRRSSASSTLLESVAWSCFGF